MSTRFFASIKKKTSLVVFLFLVSSYAFGAEEERVAFCAFLSPKNEAHKLYRAGDANVPHPFSIYKDRAKDPVFPYEQACGFGAFLFNPSTSELEYAVSYAGLSGRPIMMHFHLGAAGAEGPVIQTIFGEPYHTFEPIGTSPVPPLNGKEAPKGRSGFVTGKYTLIGNKTLSPPLTADEEKKLLFKGGIYINIHTYLNEAGEVRGQIVPCNQSNP